MQAQTGQRKKRGSDGDFYSRLPRAEGFTPSDTRSLASLPGRYEDQ